jgi:hypothetical protein
VRKFVVATHQWFDRGLRENDCAGSSTPARRLAGVIEKNETAGAAVVHSGASRHIGGESQGVGCKPSRSVNGMNVETVGPGE